MQNEQMMIAFSKDFLREVTYLVQLFVNFFMYKSFRVE